MLYPEDSLPNIRDHSWGEFNERGIRMLFGASTLTFRQRRQILRSMQLADSIASFYRTSGPPYDPAPSDDVFIAVMNRKGGGVAQSAKRAIGRVLYAYLNDKISDTDETRREFAEALGRLSRTAIGTQAAHAIHIALEGKEPFGQGLE